ncbi:MAG: hypothetical protein H7174_13085, partial [Flavobacterium sp.]|nr:hypothetical protein [Flavobacterium sp.]
MKTLFKIIFLCVATNVAAQWTYDPDQPNVLLSHGYSFDASTDMNQIEQTSATDNLGNTISIYHHWDIDVTDWSIYAQKTDVNGNLLWGPNGILVYHGTYTLNQNVFDLITKDMQMVGDGNGGVLISFLGLDENYASASGNETTTWILYIIKLDTNGNQVWATRTTVSHPDLSNGSVQQHRIIADGSGGAYLAWSSIIYVVTFPIGAFPPITAGAKIFAQHVNSDGSLQWTNDTLVKSLDLIPSSDFFYYPILAKLNDNSITVGWIDAVGNDNNNIGVFANRLTPNGNLQWGNNGIIIESGYSIPQGFSTYYDNVYFPKFYVNNNGVYVGYLVPNPSNPSNPDAGDLKVNFINNEGALTLPNSQIISTAYHLSMTSVYSTFDITTDASGNAIVLYLDKNPDDASNQSFVTKVQKV